MQHLFGRAQLSLDEVDMLRGLCTAMIKTAKTAGHPIPEQRKDESAGPEQR
jgi:tRNA/rRNA methyltransferase